MSGFVLFECVCVCVFVCVCECERAVHGTNLNIGHCLKGGRSLNLVKSVLNGAHQGLPDFEKSCLGQPITD